MAPFVIRHYGRDGHGILFVAQSSTIGQQAVFSPANLAMVFEGVVAAERFAAAMAEAGHPLPQFCRPVQCHYVVRSQDVNRQIYYLTSATLAGSKAAWGSQARAMTFVTDESAQQFVAGLAFTTERQRALISSAKPVLVIPDI